MSEFWHLDSRIDPNATLQQGDMIRFSNYDSDLSKIGIVVTADCDLEKRKHANLVTLVPIMSPLTLLECYVFIEECEARRNDILQAICRLENLDQHQNPLTLDSALEARIANIDSPASKDVELGIKFYLGKMKILKFHEYSSLMKLIGGAPKGVKALSQKVSTRGDILVLPSAQHLGVSESIAWVRHIWQIPVRDVAIRTSEIRNRPAERVARLASPFRYRLTQKMAQVFSDIGLPDVDNEIERSLGEVMK